MLKIQIQKTFFILYVILANPYAIFAHTDNQDSINYYNQLDKLAHEYREKSQYDSTLFFYQKLEKFHLRTSNHQDYFDILLKTCHIYRIKRKFDLATKYINKVETYTPQNIKVYKNLYSEFLHQKGSVIGGQGNYKEAISILKGLINYRKSFIDYPDTVAGKSYNNIGSYYYILGKSKIALDYYKKNLSLDLLRKGEITYDLISDYRNIGNVYLRMGDFNKAINHYNKTLKLSKNLKNNPRIVRIYLSLGTVYNKIGNYNKALYYYDIAKDIYIKIFGNSYEELGYLYNNIGLIYWRQTNFDQAELYYNKALHIYKNNYYKSSLPKIAGVYNNLGLICINKKGYNKGLDYYKKSLEKNMTPAAKVITLRNISKVYLLLNNINLAERSIQKALNICNNSLDSNHYEYGNTLRVFGDIMFNKGNITKAYNMYTQALKVYHNLFPEKNREIAFTYLRIANYYLKKNEFTETLHYCQKALIANDYEFNDINIHNNPNHTHSISPSNYINIILKKANTYLQLYKNTKDTLDAQRGLECYQLAFNAFEELKSNIGVNSKLYLAEITRSRFDNVFSLLYDRYKQNPENYFSKQAFNYAEKSKAAILLSAIKGENAIKFSGIPDELQSKEKETKENLDAYKNLVYEENNKSKPDSSKISIWNEKIFDLSLKYDSIIKDLEENYPNYYELKYDHNVASIDEIEQSLKEDQLLIEYVLTDSALYRFTIEKNNKTAFEKIAIGRQFYSDLGFIQNTAQPDFSKHNLTDYENYVRASYRLYHKLFDGLSERKTGKRLIIIPDGKLGYIPFEALVSTLPKFDKINYRNLSYLIKENPVSYSYSSTLLQRAMQTNRKGNKLMAVAPDYSLTKSSSGPENELNIRKKYDPLKFARVEVENINKIFKGNIYQQQQADETIFKQNAHKYNIIHLAMHADIDDESPMHSKMIFTEPADTINDGYLNTYEIYGLVLNAQLAVLSACNTGGGKINNGEGIMSLARGFIYAGVPSIVMTLWNVEDQSGAKIMTLFYNYLKKGLGKDVALQKAKIEYLNNSPQLQAHPYFWAAYVDIGNTNPLITNTWKSYTLYIVVLAILIILSFITIRSIHKKKKDRLTS